MSGRPPSSSWTAARTNGSCHYSHCSSCYSDPSGRRAACASPGKSCTCLRNLRRAASSTWSARRQHCSSKRVIETSTQMWPASESALIKATGMSRASGWWVRPRRSVGRPSLDWAPAARETACRRVRRALLHHFPLLIGMRLSRDIAQIDGAMVSVTSVYSVFVTIRLQDEVPE